MKIKGGLYLVVDTTVPEEKLIRIIKDALNGGVDILQLWNEEKKSAGEVETVCSKIIKLARAKNVPVLIANDINLCKKLNADGVHLDGYEIPSRSVSEIRKEIGEDKIIGVTCGNSVEKIRWAKENKVDYISFCSIFPSSSVDSCEIVPIEMIRKAKEILEDIPVFASGGITVENVEKVIEEGADGVAVVSAILNADDPYNAAREFKKKLKLLHAG